MNCWIRSDATPARFSASDALILVLSSGAVARTPAGTLMTLRVESTNGRFKLQKRSQLFIGAHNETLSVNAMLDKKTDS